MCAKQSLKQPASERENNISPLAKYYSSSSLAPGNTIRSGYHNWRLSPRGSRRSPVRNDAGRNALSGVKVSSPDNRYFAWWPSYYADAKATPVREVNGLSVGTTGVQVHGMYRRLVQELGRSLEGRSRTIRVNGQSVMSKSKTISAREVRWLRSSKEVG